MMETYYLAVDIGASSGRHILSHFADGHIHLEEIYRFENRMEYVDGHLCWDTERLFHEILEGLKKCREAGKIPKTMAIDTWAVDYVLLDGEGKLCGRTYGYRDHRTDGMEEAVYQVIPEEELYKRTGIQKQIFNTIYQLMAVKVQEPEVMEQAEHLLMLPDYFDYLLTGVNKTEYTNATTTQLVSPATKSWDKELIALLGYKQSLFGEITPPGTAVGHLRKEVREAVGFDLEVIQAATHDTACAVAAVPAVQEDFLYISSGTWSLMGVEQKEADCSLAAMHANLTNEGGYEYRYRFLKNIMGLWMIQTARHEWDDRYSFADLCRMAEDERDIASRVDVNDSRFLSPQSMIGAIQEYCETTNQEVPRTPGAVAAVIYQSLAESYGRTVREMEQVTGKKIPGIHIVGGGANAEYLNRLTAEATGKTIYAGPVEATAIGNAVVQMIADGVFADLNSARKCIRESFEIKEFS